MLRNLALLALAGVLITTVVNAEAVSTATPPTETPPLWMKIKANDKFERSRIANTGVSIEVRADDHVMVLGTAKQAAALEAMGVLEAKFPATDEMLDFPGRDSNFHNYEELKVELQKLNAAHPKITALDSIGKSVEGRDLMRLRISGDLAKADQMPAALIMGGHHAREHVSVEVPLMFAQRILSLYQNGDAEAVRLINTRDIQIVPMVNPDGAEFDIASGTGYRVWRKNRANNGDNTMGVDLNRNYDQGFGGEGASDETDGETYHGPLAFSEPETRAVKAWVDSTPNTSTLLSIHTYSQLILYPWGGSYDKVPDGRDGQVFETMAKKMATWNGYEPMQASDLYIATGDTCDWAYAAHKIFAFTFELDPNQFSFGGFYPGQDKVPAIFEKNVKPMMYLIDMADNPYRAIEPKAAAFGLNTPLLQ